MQKIKQFITKYWFILAIIVVIAMRVLLSFSLPSFYLNNLRYDDSLMVDQAKSLNNGEYLGEYSDITLIKGLAYPIFLYITNLLGMSYSMMLTIIYILACIYFIYSLKKIITNKLILFTIFAFLMLNPISFSSELFQRLYRNSLTIIELLFFFGTIINIISSKKRCYLYYIFLGIITAIMFLTREDNIWVVIIYAIVVIYKLYKERKIKTILQALIPICITAILLNIVCYINYINYGIYTYNEITNSSFKKAYLKILQIKDDEKKDQVAIPKSTLYKLSENSKLFNLSKQFIDAKYNQLSNGTDEIYNGNMVWYLRYWIYKRNNIKTGEEANKYWEDLSDEIDRLFEEGKLEKEFVIPSTKINMPTENELKQLPKNLLDAIIYTTTYQNVKTFKESDLEERGTYNIKVNAYSLLYRNYHNAENMINNNPVGFDIIKNMYKYFTIVFSIVALVIYVKNIRKKDKLNLILHIIFITYTIIICGVTYTHTTSHDAIRYCYLGNIYILQNIFILLNLVRIYEKKKGSKNDISNNTSIQ